LDGILFNIAFYDVVFGGGLSANISWALTCVNGDLKLAMFERIATFRKNFFWVNAGGTVTRTGHS